MTSSNNLPFYQSKKSMPFKIGGRCIDTIAPPYIIAELSANHLGQLERALALIKAAKEAGADAVKLQTYRPDTLTLNCASEDFYLQEGLWAGQTLYDLYQAAHTPWEWHSTLFDYANSLGITLFSSPFDQSAVDLLESLDAPAYKIASFEAIDLELIRYVARTGKPIIISTGLSNLEEIEEALMAAQQGGASRVALLLCVSAYPASPQDYHLRTLIDMRKRFACEIGISDHTLSPLTPLVAVALGASLIEKHFTLSRAEGGPDAAFSLEPNELRDLCRETKIAWESLGEIYYGCKSAEQSNLKFRRSLYVIQSMKKGDQFTSDNLKSIRPGFGLKPKYYTQILGRRAAMDISFGSALKENMVMD